MSKSEKLEKISDLRFISCSEIKISEMKISEIKEFKDVKVKSFPSFFPTFLSNQVYKFRYLRR